MYLLNFITNSRLLYRIKLKRFLYQLTNVVPSSAKLIPFIASWGAVISKEEGEVNRCLLEMVRFVRKGIPSSDFKGRVRDK